MYDQQYFDTFYFAHHYIADTQAAEDICTEVFLKLWDRLADFDHLSAIQKFVQVSVKNACLNYLRSQKRASARHQQIYSLGEQDHLSDAQPHQVTARLYQHIYEEINKLSPQLKKVFELSYIQGLSNEAIAQQLGIAQQSVRNDKSRALKLLRMALEQKDVYGIFLLWLHFHQAVINE